MGRINNLIVRLCIAYRCITHIVNRQWPVQPSGWPRFRGSNLTTTSFRRPVFVRLVVRVQLEIPIHPPQRREPAMRPCRALYLAWKRFSSHSYAKLESDIICNATFAIREETLLSVFISESNRLGNSPACIAIGHNSHNKHKRTDVPHLVESNRDRNHQVGRMSLANRTHEHIILKTICIRGEHFFPVANYRCNEKAPRNSYVLAARWLQAQDLIYRRREPTRICLTKVSRTMGDRLVKEKKIVGSRSVPYGWVGQVCLLIMVDISKWDLSWLISCQKCCERTNDSTIFY